MKNKKLLIRSSRFPYHVTARSNNQEWFYLPIPVVWKIFSEKFQLVQEKYGAQVNAFVLMSNHFHLILSTPNKNIDRIMLYLMREVSRGIGRVSGRINHVFGARYRSSLIYDPIYFAHAYKYVFRNPVQAGLVQRAEHYQFSTIKSEIGVAETGFRTVPALPDITRMVPKDRKEFLFWLNQAYDEPEHQVIRRALRRREFKFTKRKDNKRIVRRLTESIWDQKEAGGFGEGSKGNDCRRGGLS